MLDKPIPITSADKEALVENLRECLTVFARITRPLTAPEIRVKSMLTILTREVETWDSTTDIKR